MVQNQGQGQDQHLNYKTEAKALTRRLKSTPRPEGVMITRQMLFYSPF